MYQRLGFSGHHVGDEQLSSRRKARIEVACELHRRGDPQIVEQPGGVDGVEDAELVEEGAVLEQPLDRLVQVDDPHAFGPARFSVSGWMRRYA